MKSPFFIASMLLGLCGGSTLSAQMAANPTPDQMLLLRNSVPYMTCLRDEFRKLTTPNFDDPDVYPLMKVTDEAVFATIKPACASQREALLAVKPGAESHAKALDDWETEQAQEYADSAQRNRARMAGWVEAIRVPGPRPAVPLVEIIDTMDYPSLALRQQEQGRVLATYTVGTDGRVSICKGEGATEVLHNAVCAVVVRRWRYAPALDAAGQRVVEVRTKTISFAIH